MKGVIAAIAALALLVLVAGVAAGLGRSRGVASKAALPASSAPASTTPGAGAPLLLPVTPPVAAIDGGPHDVATTPALVAAEEFRLSVCDCETRECIDEANQTYVKGMGQVAPGSSNAESRAEMHAATTCIRQILARLRDGGAGP